MSASDRGEHASLGPRARRVRNRCLAALAARRRLPVPTAHELDQFGDDVSLFDALSGWERTHTPVAGRSVPQPTTRPPAWWQSGRLARAAMLVVAAIFGVLAGTRWLPRARAQSSGEVAGPVWSMVSDSTRGVVNERFLMMSNTDVRFSARLSASEMAGVIFGSRRLRMLPVDSLSARLDSTLHVRGRIRGGPPFELSGDIRLLRRGVGELHVIDLIVDGVRVSPDRSAELLTRAGRHSAPSERLRFDVPSFVASIRVSADSVEILKRER